jgi:hypothetical protein
MNFLLMAAALYVRANNSSPEQPAEI